MQNNNNQMDPQDIKNMITFALISLGLWLLYNTYIVQPRKEAMAQQQKARAEIMMKNPELRKPITFSTRDDALTQSGERISFENQHIKGSIALKGGYIDDVSLKEHYQTLEKKEYVHLLTPPKTQYGRFMDYGWIARTQGVDMPNAQTIWRVRGNDQLAPNAPVVLFWHNEQGVRFERHIAVDENYVFTITQHVYNYGEQDIILHPYAAIAQNNVPLDYVSKWVAHEGPMGFIGDELVQRDYGAMAKEDNKAYDAQTGWIGFSDTYWLTALMPAQDVMAKYQFKYDKDVFQGKRDRYSTKFTGAALSVPAGGEVSQAFHLYAGAKKVITLNDYEKSLGVKHLELAVDFGWFWFFTKPFFYALHYLGLWVGNMGVAIIILTFCVRSLVFPLANISYRSFAKMKVVAPKISELREKHGDDKEKLQGEIVKLYQKEGVNPLSGCLPIVLQIPFFFAFYKILLITIEIRHAPFFGWIHDLSARDPTNITNLFGLLPYDAPEFIHFGVWPCMMLVAMLVQKKLNPPPQDKMQRYMMNFFPFFISFIMAKFASGLVIYWTVSAFLSIIQQMIIMRSMGVPIYIFEKDKFEKDLEEQVDKGPDVHPLAQMAEDETEKALFGDDGSFDDAGDAKGDEKKPAAKAKPKAKKGETKKASTAKKKPAAKTKKSTTSKAKKPKTPKD